MNTHTTVKKKPRRGWIPWLSALALLVTFGVLAGDAEAVTVSAQDGFGHGTTPGGVGPKTGDPFGDRFQKCMEFYLNNALRCEDLWCDGWWLFKTCDSFKLNMCLGHAQWAFECCMYPASCT